MKRLNLVLLLIVGCLLLTACGNSETPKCVEVTGEGDINCYSSVTTDQLQEAMREATFDLAVDAEATENTWSITKYTSFKTEIIDNYCSDEINCSSPDCVLEDITIPAMGMNPHSISVLSIEFTEEDEIPKPNIHEDGDVVTLEFIQSVTNEAGNYNVKMVLEADWYGDTSDYADRPVCKKVTIIGAGDEQVSGTNSEVSGDEEEKSLEEFFNDCKKEDEEGISPICRIQVETNFTNGDFIYPYSHSFVSAEDYETFLESVSDYQLVINFGGEVVAVKNGDGVLLSEEE